MKDTHAHTHKHTFFADDIRTIHRVKQRSPVQTRMFEPCMHIAYHTHTYIHACLSMYTSMHV